MPGGSALDDFITLLQAGKNVITSQPYNYPPARDPSFGQALDAAAEAPTPPPSGRSKRWWRPWPWRSVTSGVEMALLEAGSVSSGALDAPLRYFADGDVYGPLDAQMANARGAAITVEEAATAIAGAVDADALPLRIPIGEPARMALAARRNASDETPFRIAPTEW